MAWGTEDGVRYQYFEDLKQLTLDLGYSTIKEAIITEYEKLGGTNPVGKKLGLCGTTIHYKLRAFKYEHIKGRGGPNNPTGIKYINHEVKGLSK
ncbi:hypothetical protein KAR91_68655 [Candidatus Pacearchaeota archaeon]|nr:hypothetical protein [Candidatus Pacearchaeota archaeon]